MRVLFFESSPIWINTLPAGFRDAGHEVIISGALTKRKIIRLLSKYKPHLTISMGWGKEQIPIKQYWIRKYSKMTNIPHVYWSVEDPAFTVNFTIPLLQRLQPDFVFSISESTVTQLKALGYSAACMDFGINSKIHTPSQEQRIQPCRVAVVANGYPDILTKYPQHYRHQSIQTLITPLLKEKIRIDFWGKDWSQMKNFVGSEIPEDWMHGHLPYEEANQVYTTADIVIGLQNYPEQVTQRTYEILGSGGFLITMNTPGVNKLFIPGKEIVTSNSQEETLQLVQYYLDHPQKRSEIREQGRAAAQSHSYTHRAEYMIHILKDQGVCDF